MSRDKRPGSPELRYCSAHNCSVESCRRTPGRCTAFVSAVCPPPPSQCAVSALTRRPWELQVAAAPGPSGEADTARRSRCRLLHKAPVDLAGRSIAWRAAQTRRDSASRGTPPAWDIDGTLLSSLRVASGGRGVTREACSNPGSDEAQRAGNEVVVVEAGVVPVVELIAEAAQP
jgi:hypothetical protein